MFFFNCFCELVLTNIFVVFKDLCPLDVDRDNLIEKEIGSRMARVQKVEMARPIKCSFGDPKIDDFKHLVQTTFSSLTFRNLAHQIPKIENIKSNCFSSQGAQYLREAVLESESNFFTI